MQTDVYKLFGIATGAADAAAQIMFQRNGKITSIFYDVAADVDTNAATLTGEVSFRNTYQGATNDTVGPLISRKLYNNLATSGMTAGLAPSFIAGLAIPIRSGNILYLNFGSASGTITMTVTAYIFVMSSGR